MTVSENVFQSELNYGTAMYILKEMLAAGLISKQEFTKVEKLYAVKYAPTFRQEARQD